MSKTYWGYCEPGFLLFKELQIEKGNELCGVELEVLMQTPGF